MISTAPFTKELIVTKVRIDLPSFELNATEATAHVTMFTEETRFVEAKTVTIPPEVYVAWGTDDNFIIDYVLTELGLTRIIPESS